MCKIVKTFDGYQEKCFLIKLSAKKRGNILITEHIQTQTETMQENRSHHRGTVSVCSVVNDHHSQIRCQSLTCGLCSCLYF